VYSEILLQSYKIIANYELLITNNFCNFAPETRNDDEKNSNHSYSDLPAGNRCRSVGQGRDSQQPAIVGQQLHGLHGTAEAAHRRPRGHDAIKLRCADDFFVEVVAAFEVLSRDYDRQRKALFRAFLAANDLLLPASDDDAPSKPLSDAEERLVEDAARLSLGIRKSALHKQLAGA
jgi:hypothetical protein